MVSCLPDDLVGPQVPFNCEFLDLLNKKVYSDVECKPTHIRNSETLHISLAVIFVYYKQ